MNMPLPSLRQRLADRRLSIGSWVTLGHPAIAEIMARAGFEWVVADLEHSVMSLADAENVFRTVEPLGAIPLARMSSNDAVQIKRVMDAGAHGIVVPMVNSAADAARAVSAMRYPNRGTRGVGLARAQRYGAAFPTYRAWLEEGAAMVAQIEHIDAVNRIDEILAVEGVDAFIVGPYDLSASLRVPGQFDHPDFLAAMGRLRELAQSHAVPAGIHVVEPNLEELAARIDDGYRFVAYSLDVRMLDVSCRRGLEGR